MGKQLKQSRRETGFCLSCREMDYWHGLKAEATERGLRITSSRPTLRMVPAKRAAEFALRGRQDGHEVYGDGGAARRGFRVSPSIFLRGFLERGDGKRLGPKFRPNGQRDGVVGNEGATFLHSAAREGGMAWRHPHNRVSVAAGLPPQFSPFGAPSLGKEAQTGSAPVVSGALR